MKVLITHERFAPDFAGGAEYVILEQARHLQRSGLEVKVLTTGDPSIHSHEGIATERLPIHPYRFNLATRKIAESASDVDLIQTNNYHACLPTLRAARRVGKPVVCMIHGLFGEAWKEMRGPIIGRAFMAWEQFLLTRRYDHLIFVSEFSREAALKGDTLESPTSVINPGIDLDKFKPATSKDNVVLFVGKIDVRKGIEDVLAVARALPETQFRVVGWADRKTGYQAAAPANVEWVGPKFGKELHEEFARARVFLFPSKVETFGLVVVEAMASGCAVVSTVPLPFEGFRVEPGDVQAQISAVRKLLSDTHTSGNMGQANVVLAQLYTWERHTRALLDLYEEVLRSAKRDHPR